MRGAEKTAKSGFTGVLFVVYQDKRLFIEIAVNQGTFDCPDKPLFEMVVETAAHFFFYVYK